MSLKGTSKKENHTTQIANFSKSGKIVSGLNSDTESEKELLFAECVKGFVILTALVMWPSKCFANDCCHGYDLSPLL